jgi:hypothetical protein
MNARSLRTIVSENRIARFHAAVDERFGFLLDLGFRITERSSYSDRFGQVWFQSAATQIYLSWDAYDGSLEAKAGDTNLWPLVTAAGLWDAGRHYSGYAGYAIEAMQHGLDRVVTLLKMRPELLGKDPPARDA